MKLKDVTITLTEQSQLVLDGDELYNCQINIKESGATSFDNLKKQVMDRLTGFSFHSPIVIKDHCKIESCVFTSDVKLKSILEVNGKRNFISNCRFEGPGTSININGGGNVISGNNYLAVSK